MQFPDALRAQYYIRPLKNELKKISLFFEGDLSCFISKLSRALDQILLPVVAHELESAKNANELTGKTPAERYRSFFIQNHNFTQQAQNLPKKYPFLFSQLDQTIVSAFNNPKGFRPSLKLT